MIQENLRQTQPYLLEEKMSRKSKITRYTTKRSTKPVKPKDPATARLEHPNINEPAENDLKRNTRKCLKFLNDGGGSSVYVLLSLVNKETALAL